MFIAKTKGFTIVELLIVVVVIGILAAISLVAYTGITQSADKAALASELSQAEKSLSIYKVNNEVYPDDIDDILGEGFGSGTLDYNLSEDKLSYCLQSVKGTFSFFISNSLTTPTQGYCDGTTGIESDEPYEEPDIPESPALTVYGDGGGLTVSMNETWNQITITWDPIEGAIRYELQINKGDGDWVYVNKDSGHPSFGYGGLQSCLTNTSSSSCTSQLSPSQESIVWTNSYAYPVDFNHTFSYRLKAVTASSEQVATATLKPQQAYPNKVKNFRVEPASPDDISQYSLSWDLLTNTNIPNHRYEIQVNRGDGEWVYVNKTTGGSNFGYGGLNSCASNSTSADCTARIASSTDSLTWHDQYSRVVNYNNPYSYRIRIASSISNLYSDWQYYTHQIVGPEQWNPPTNFSVAGESSLTLSWSNPEVRNIPNSRIQLQVNRGDGEWIYVHKEHGSAGWGYGYTCGTSDNNTNCTGRIDGTASSLLFSGNYSTPPVGSTYQYRIRYVSTTVANVASDWVTTSYTR